MTWATPDPGSAGAAAGGRRPVARASCFRYVPTMTDNVQDAMLEILKRIQMDVSDVKSRVGGVETHMVEMQTTMRKMRRDQAGTLVMMRATAGDFDERISELEERMDAWDAKKS